MMEAKSLTILKHLAQLLRMRKEANSRPYHLFLSSCISLTPSLLRQVCDTDDWRTFCDYLSTLSPCDRLSILSLALQRAPPLEDYLPLARLILAGFFPTILTTNTDSALEDALDGVLVERGMRPYSFQTLIVDRDKDDDIAQALTERDTSIRIVKLHGSVRDGKLPNTFPEVLTLRADLMESVRRYFNQDIVIVGSLAYDNDINREIDRSSRNHIYYVLPHYPTEIDDVVQIIQARGCVAEAHVITGPYGECARFFATLETYTLPGKPAVPLSTNSYALPYLDDPLLVPDASSELPVDTNIPPRADILLVTVTEIETKAVLQVFRQDTDHIYNQYSIGTKIYYELDTMNGGALTFLVQSEMGVSGTGSSLLTVYESIQALGPSSVIMVGIAFGVDSHKQRLGDILVSQQLCGYEHQRHGTAYDGSPTIILRGDRVTASVKLLSSFRSGSLDWSEQPYESRRGRWGRRVDFGAILSGEKLVDNVEFRNQLLALEPQAIGGEMEGFGLYVAAQNARVDWILVKAICDWADGNKSAQKIVPGANGTIRTTSTKTRDQKKAADNAAQFTMHVLRNTRLV
jgi:nucleoside phosphorylase